MEPPRESRPQGMRAASVSGAGDQFSVDPNADAGTGARRPRTITGRKVAEYVERVTGLRRRLDVLAGRRDEAALIERRELLAELDAAYVRAGLLRSADPEVRRLRAAIRRAARRAEEREAS